MADHFLTKTRIDLDRCIEVDGAAVVEQFDELHAQVSAAVGPETASLLAEPLISKGNDRAAATVSWYTNHVGTGTPINRLDPASQEALRAVLQTRLSALATLMTDDWMGSLISAALYIGSSGDIWSVDGQPVLINWGMMPEAGSDAVSRKAHYAATLGSYLPLSNPPPLNASEHAAHAIEPPSPVTTAKPQTASLAPEEMQAPSSVPPEPQPVVAARGRVPVIAWLPLLLLLLLFGAALAWLLVPGNRIFANDEPAPAIADQNALLAAREINRALEARLGALDEALAGAVCRADGTLLMPDGLTVEGLLPPGFRQGPQLAGQVVPGDTTPTLPPAADRVVLPGTDGQITDTSSLLAHIDSRTAMVLVAREGGASAGTGFFVGPNLLVTNFHVINEAAADDIAVTNKSIGVLKAVEVLKTLGPMREVGADFALLRVKDVEQPFFTLRQSDASMRLQSVIAAGYPGDLLRTDDQFRALRSGDIEAVPELTVTDGTVNTEQSLSPTTNAVVHSAPISKGNSGGPLIDLCGRVVGVNTFVVQGPLRNLNFALATDDLLAFLAGTDAAPQVSDTACTPLVARPSPALPASNP